MELRRLKTLFLLEMIAEDRTRSQRDFSESLDISLGLVNTFIKRLISKGFCTVKTLPSNRLMYALTPLGATEKTKLAYEYIANTYRSYKQVFSRLQRFYANLEAEGVHRIVFLGAGDIFEVALQAIKGTRLEVVAVVDPQRAGERRDGQVVRQISDLTLFDYDAMLVTTTENPDIMIKMLSDAQLPMGRLRYFD